LSSQIKELDIDRVFVDAALTELQRLSGAARMRRPIEGLGFNTETKSFQEFATPITRKSGVVKRAKNEFVKANLRLVVSIARRFNHGRLPLPDLIQEGNIGLMKAVERYDYRRGFRFSTYASWWIRHAISRALADKGRAVRLPVHMIDAYHRIAKSERELQSKLERPATTEEIASVTGIEAEKLEKMRTFLADNPVSLDRSLSEDDGRRLIDVLVDPNEAPSPPEQMMSSETQQEMLKLLSVLKPIEADILRKRFGLINDHERTLKEIGDEYRLSRERVRQLQEQALGKMRKAMAKREIL
jgi:RNA polymerase primary sigma factor